MMQAVALPAAVGVGVPSRGASSMTDARITFDGLIGESGASEVSGVLPDTPSEADPEELESPAMASDAEDDLAEQDVPDVSDLPVPAEDGPVPMDILQPEELAVHLHDQDPMTEFESSDGLMVGDGETKPIPSVFAAPVAVSAPEGVPIKAGDDMAATNLVPPENAKKAIFIDASEVPSDTTGVEGDPGRIGNAPVPSSHELPVQMENGIETGQVTAEATSVPTESDDPSVLFTSPLSASPSETVVDPAKGGMPANTRAVPSGSSIGSETMSSMVADAPNAGLAKAMPDVRLTPTGIITAKQTEGGVPISAESMQRDVLIDVPEVPAGTDVPKNLTPLGPVATDDALPEPQLREVLPLSGEAEDLGFDLTVDQSPPSAMAEADPQTAETASDRPTDPVRPRSAIVPNVVERVAALPREVGETVIHLKPHGMGLIEVSIQQARDGGLDIVLRIQNPLVLEAMQAERHVVAQAIGGQGGAASGSLTMDLFQSGSGQRGAQGDGSGGTSRSGSLPTTEESLDDAAGQTVTRQIIQADRVNITT